MNKRRQFLCSVFFLIVTLILNLNTYTVFSQDSEFLDLTLNVATPEEIEGTFELGDRGLSFKSVNDEAKLFLEITTLDNEILIEFSGNDDEISGEIFDGRLTIVISKSKESLNYSPDSTQQYATDVLYEGDISVFDDLTEMPEYQLLPTLSFALGHEGYLGSVYPSALTIHQIALGASSHLAESEEDGDPLQPGNNPGIVYRVKHPFQDDLTIGKVDEWEIFDPCSQDPPCPSTGCSDEEYAMWSNACTGTPKCEEKPNKDRGCFGMCGDGCTCWKQICGDCCYHKGCATHDATCRAGIVIKVLACFNPQAIVFSFFGGGGCSS